jgi:RimJ/RimL family protein N-acetyltransferase
MRVVLETDRLVLREFTGADAGLLFALDSDPEVMRYVGPHTLPSVEAYADHIRTRFLPLYALDPPRGVWAAAEKAAGRFVGWFHLKPGADYRFAAECGYRPGDADLGYRLARAHWGRGLATEGAAALVRMALADVSTARIVACALAANRASVRVLEKVGLTRTGEVTLPGFGETALTFARVNPAAGPAAKSL